jgi:hypothetical protein
MGCCGGKRAALRNEYRKPAVSVPDAPRVDVVRESVTTGVSSLVRGPVSGRHYQFRGGILVGEIDPRDSEALRRFGLL